MSWYLANEKWIDGDEDGLVDQFASGRGLTDLTTAIEAAGEYPALDEFFREGVSERVSELRAELAKFAAKEADADIAKTARGLAKLMKGQTLVMVTQGIS